MAKLHWSALVDVDGTKQIAVSETSENFQAVDRIQMKVPGPSPAPGVWVDVQPGGTEQVRLMVIKASAYDDGTGDQLTFVVSGGGATSDPIILSGPQIYSGGSINLLGVDPQRLTFTSGLASEVSIEIFVARRAVAEQ